VQQAAGADLAQLLGRLIIWPRMKRAAPIGMTDWVN